MNIRIYCEKLFQRFVIAKVVKLIHQKSINWSMHILNIIDI
ncbi:hypothetical protein BLA29_012620 [Euroglyphus maynei]|uniref:Uncharacterized protein n=1 Tax=Euroglyphus maynei TaxID=6958 RepID=A0A1Y3BNT7_EURMA|nr:hypothetical protein BLA29_012620 [Euroglyphus maynei]